MISQIVHCKHLFLIVHATILVILSCRQPQRASAASVPSQQQQQQPPPATRNHFRPQETTALRSSSPSQIDARSTPVTNPALEPSALVYLQRYGYMQAAPSATSNNLISEESFSGAVAEFQQFAGLPQTGQVDNETIHMMRLPRCGNTDKPMRANLSRAAQLVVDRRQRRKRYALQGSKWRRQELTYRISQYPTKFVSGNRKHEVDEQIERAFGIWSQVAPIDFVVKREGRVHIDIRFASGDHGDGDAFDGPGNTLAHAYFPQYGGDAHFDDQEYWTVDSYAGTNIFQVAAHELGHSLGLGHSNVREALMAPFYQKYKPNFKLHLDDVLAIQALYGEKSEGPLQATSTSTSSTTSTSRPSALNPAFGGGRPRDTPIYKGHRRDEPTEEPKQPTTTTTSTAATMATAADEGGNPDSNGIDDEPRPSAADGGESEEPAADLCTDSMIDAVTRTEDGSTYVFRGNHYWLLTQEGLARGYPRRIASDWDGLPGRLDAALTWADGKTFFFKGNKYWRFKNRRRDAGYPKLISAGFAGIPDDLDAAFVWSGNGRTYFFKGAEYWRFDSKAEPPVSSEYPRSIRVWLGVPSHVNAAFKWENNVTYFFKGNQYYRFNDRDFRVESRGRPQFPRQTAEWWFGCVGSNLAQRAMPGSTGFGQAMAPAGSRTARVFQGNSNGNQPEPSDWSLLAGLSSDQTRSMGTHISDHQKPSAPTLPPMGERNWQEEESEDNISELDIDRRLAPGRHAAGQHKPSEHSEPGERRRRPAQPTRGAAAAAVPDGDQMVRGYRSSIEANGFAYRTNSMPKTTAISQTATSNGACRERVVMINRWSPLLCGLVMIFTLMRDNRMRLLGGSFEIG